MFKTFAIFASLTCATLAHAACALSPEPHPRGVIGLQLFYPDDSSAWEDADNLGVTWLRLELRWDMTEVREGQFDFSFADRVIALANKHPQRILLLLNHVPKWAVSDADRLPGRAAAAISVFVKRYGERISAYEVFNEPNLPGPYGWPDAWATPQESATVYARTLSAVSSAIRGLDKKAFITSGGLSPQNSPESYLRHILRQTPHNCVDSIGVHFYGERGRFAIAQRNVATLLDQEAWPKKPAWVTEYGTAINSERANILTSLFAERESTPITFFFADRDISWFTERYGLSRKDGTKKPDYQTFKRLMKSSSTTN